MQQRRTTGNARPNNNTNNTNAGNNNNLGRGDGTGEDPDGEESLSGLLSQLLGANPELRQLLKFSENYVPFFVLLAAKIFFDHLAGKVFSFLSTNIVKVKCSSHRHRSVLLSRDNSHPL